MFIYAQLDNSNNVFAISEVHSRVNDPKMILLKDWEDAKLRDHWNGATFEPAPPEVITSKIITKLAFLNRLGDPVLGALELAADTANAKGIRARVFRLKLLSTTYIDLVLSDTQNALNALVADGYMLATNATIILNTPVAAAEIPVFLKGAQS